MRLFVQFRPGLCMNGSDNPYACPHSRLYCEKICLLTQLIHRNDLRGHGSKQHMHADLLGAIVQHIGPWSQIVLGNPLMAGRNLGTLVHHPHLQSPSMILPTGKDADQIPQIRGLAHTGRCKDQRIIDAVSLSDIRKQPHRTSLDFVGDADIQSADVRKHIRPIATASVMVAHMSAQPNAMSSLNGKKALLHFLLQGIQRISGEIIQHLPQH